MKILQIGKFYHPVHGGIETVVQNLAEGLSRNGDEVTVLCSSSQTKNSIESIAGVRVWRSAYFGSLFSQPLTPFLPREIKRLVDEADVVNVHSPNPLAELSLLGFLKNRTPLIVTYHSDIVRQKFLGPMYSPFQRALLERARKIVVPTEYHIKYSSMLRSFSAKCDVIPFGLQGERYVATPHTLEKSASLKGRYGRFVLFVGRLVGYKGVKYLIEAMRSVEANLVILGRGPLEKELQAQASELGLESKIHFVTGAESQDDLNAYLHACELFVLPSISKNEAFGMVLLEAMAFAKPLVSTRIESGVRLVNDDGVTGLQVDPKDSRALAQAINTVLGDEAKRMSMAQAALDRFNTQFSADTMVKAYRALYARSL